LQLSGNLHEIEPGVYRSAQPGAAEIDALGRNLHLKTILNLRGAHPGTGWYDAEAKAAADAGARLISIGLSANREPDVATLAVLIETLRSAEKPLLIHCYSGSDRSGLASALYELTVAHRSPTVAGRQLSFRFGHFPWLTSRSGAMDRTFDSVTATLP
jgi:protein tyrosine/serine phosphatase